MTEKKNDKLGTGKIKDAFRIAELHLKKFEKTNQNITRQIGNIYPLYEPFGEEPTIYEVVLKDEKGQKEGYILVSTTKKYPPVIKFAFHGKGDFETLREKVGTANFTPVIYTPFYIVAENERGGFIADYGERPVVYDKSTSKQRNFRYTSFKKCFTEHKEKKVKQLEESALHKWNKILKKSLKSVSDESEVDYIEPADVPDYNFQIVTADHIEYLGRYTQIPPNQGANSAHNFYTGCTACAWMCLIGYHDNVYTLDLLRGTHETRGASNSYPSRVMVRLSEHLGTKKSKDGNGGSCDPDNIKKGYSFIQNTLGYTVVNKKYVEDDGIPALQVVYDYLCMYGVPSLISIPGHSLIAYEVLADWHDDRGDHYIRVYQGWGGSQSDDPYISYDLIDDGAWTFERISTNHEISLDYQSITAPVTLELGDPQIQTELVMAIRLPDENIGLLYSENGVDFELRYEINATGDTPPSITVGENRYDPYIAWKEVGGGLRLAQVYPKGNRIIDLPAPLDLSGFGNVGPVIQVFRDKLFYIWDNNITYTNLQNLERSGRPWPTEYGYHDYNDSYLSSLGIIIPMETPSFITDGYRLYYSYRMDRHYTYGKEMLIFKISNEGDIEYYMDNDGNTIYQGGKRKLLYWNNTLYGTSYGAISELTRSTSEVTEETKYYPYGISTDNVNIGVFSSYEIGPSVFSVYLRSNNKIRIRYHSIDKLTARLDYTGWPDFW